MLNRCFFDPENFRGKQYHFTEIKPDKIQGQKEKQISVGASRRHSIR